MSIRTIVTGLLVVSLASSALPAGAETLSAAGEPAASSPAPVSPASVSPDFKASLDRAVAASALASQPAARHGRGLRPKQLAPEFAAEAAGAGEGQVVPGGGGGMGTVGIIMTIVGTAAGIGATVYMLKQMKKIEGGVK